jgi:AraC-like DNA-binding protein
MKLMFEKVLPNPGASWRYWCYALNSIEFNWHYHPEYEICLTLNSCGQRYVGDNIDNYGDWDLTLMGPHLPHSWCSAKEIEGQSQTVYIAQIPVGWLDPLVFSMPDLASIKPILEASRQGLLFSQNLGQRVAKIFGKMANQGATERFIGLLQILQLMAKDDEAKTLSSSGYNLSIPSDISMHKLDKIIRYLHEHFKEDLRAEHVAKLVHMSTNHFHRFIKQRTEQTFTELVNQLRISKACSLLINTGIPIMTISDQCGFNNVSNFNRRFLQYKKMTPSLFRKNYLNRGIHRKN